MVKSMKIIYQKVTKRLKICSFDRNVIDRKRTHENRFIYEPCGFHEFVHLVTIVTDI